MNIVVAVAPDYHYFNKLEYENGTKVYRGLVFDILGLLCPNCKYSYIQSDSYLHPTTGVLALVKTGKADMAVGAISMTYKRMKDFDFLEYFMTSPISFMINHSHSGHPVLDFTNAFHPMVWLFAVVTLLTLIITVNVSSLWCVFKEKTRRTSAPLKEMTTDIIAIVLRQGVLSLNCTKLRPSNICLMMSILIGSLIVTTSYTAKLISFRTVEVGHHIDTIEKLIHHPEYDLIILRDGIAPQIFQANTKTFQALWKMVNKDPERNIINSSQEEDVVNNRVKKEKAALVVDRDTNLRLLKNNCGLRAAKDIIFANKLAFPVARDFKYKALFNLRLLRMRETGLIERIWERQIRRHDGPPHRCHSNTSGARVTFHEVQGHMMWLMFGGLFACAVLAIEIKYAAMRSRNNSRERAPSNNDEQVTSL